MKKINKKSFLIYGLPLVFFPFFPFQCEPETEHAQVMIQDTNISVDTFNDLDAFRM